MEVNKDTLSCGVQPLDLIIQLDGKRAENLVDPFGECNLYYKMTQMIANVWVARLFTTPSLIQSEWLDCCTNQFCIACTCQFHICSLCVATDCCLQTFADIVELPAHQSSRKHRIVGFLVTQKDLVDPATFLGVRMYEYANKKVPCLVV